MRQGRSADPVETTPPWLSYSIAQEGLPNGQFPGVWSQRHRSIFIRVPGVEQLRQEHPSSKFECRQYLDLYIVPHIGGNSALTGIQTGPGPF